MASYVEGALVAGEEVVKLGHISLWGFWHLILFGVLLLPAFGIGLVLLAIAYIRYKSTEVAVTTRRAASCADMNALRNSSGSAMPTIGSCDAPVPAMTSVPKSSMRPSRP